MSLVPPATGVSFSSWWVINMIFNGVLRQRKPAWWSKYSESLSFVFRQLLSAVTDYVLSAALDCGVAVATVIIFFCITLPAGSFNWWGNIVYTQTADGQGTPYQSISPRGYFGPPKGSWH